MSYSDLNQKAIKAWAAAAGRDVNAVARELGVSYTTIWRWASGKRSWPAEKAAQMRALMTGEAVPAAKAVRHQPPTFAEHVLYTAGRIAELANQIQIAATQQRDAATQQQRMTRELHAAATTAASDHATATNDELAHTALKETLGPAKARRGGRKP